jgi:acylphosphatase
MLKRAEILAVGKVQGVGFRAFVVQEATRLGLVGWTKNLTSGDVLTVAEGNENDLAALYKALQTGPRFAHVERHHLTWSNATGEFSSFTVRL